MRALLDVNVLLALFDQSHVHHSRAKKWFKKQAPSGWASCALTQNGFIRIVSQPKYPNPLTTSRAMELLQSAVETQFHDFWPADVSLVDQTRVHREQVHGPRQLTDLYLLTLAVERGGCLATFDESIPLAAVAGAGKKHLVLV